MAIRGLPPDSLDGMRFAVFGLGDSGYAKYNAAARKLHARLLQLGAKELVSARERRTRRGSDFLILLISLI